MFTRAERVHEASFRLVGRVPESNGQMKWVIHITINAMTQFTNVTLECKCARYYGTHGELSAAQRCMDDAVRKTFEDLVDQLKILRQLAAAR